eukprot:6455666-Amphidinium_carterae.1
MHLNEDEIPFTEKDLPDKFSEETRRAPPAERVIPTVPDFIASDRLNKDGVPRLQGVMPVDSS